MIIKESIICDVHKDMHMHTKKCLGGNTATKVPNVAQANLFLTSLEKSMMNIKFKKTYQQTNLSTKRKSIYLKSKQQNFTNKKFSERYYLHIKSANSQLWVDVVSATIRHGSLPLSS